MNYTIGSSQEGLITNTNKSGWATLDVGYTVHSIGDVIIEALTAKVMEYLFNFTLETDSDLHGDNSFQQVESALLQEGSAFVDNNIFPLGTYGIDCSGVGSDATTFGLTDIQTAKLACAVYMQKTGNYVEVIISANDTSFQSALLHYEIPFKVMCRQEVSRKYDE